MNTLTRVLILILALSCATRKSIDQGNNSQIVNIDDLYNVDRVQIEKTNSVDYGPVLQQVGEETNTNKEKSESEKKYKLFSIDLYPALYKSFGYISLFKSLEREGLKPAVISSFGFSSIVGALHAKYLKSNVVEWKAFELYQSLSSEKPYSKDWLEKIERFLKKEFKQTRLSQLKVLLVIPSIYKKAFKISPNQKVVDAILSSLDIESSQSSSAMLKSTNQYFLSLHKFGVEQTYRVSLLPDAINFKQPNGYLLATYSRLSGITVENENTYIKSYESKTYIDSILNLSDEINQAQSFSSDIVEKIIKQIKK